MALQRAAQKGLRAYLLLGLHPVLLIRGPAPLSCSEVLGAIKSRTPDDSVVTNGLILGLCQHQLRIWLSEVLKSAAILHLLSSLKISGAVVSFSFFHHVFCLLI